ncbi:hypothetical protein JB92DRAFT_2835510 [Gautieria morchelliformis]|nr:hypothetical protein JB92DRAFT_2835510 [Gautieria morchelliformis]
MNALGDLSWRGGSNPAMTSEFGPREDKVCGVRFGLVVKLIMVSPMQQFIGTKERRGLHGIGTRTSLRANTSRAVMAITISTIIWLWVYVYTRAYVAGYCSESRIPVRYASTMPGEYSKIRHAQDLSPRRAEMQDELDEDDSHKSLTPDPRAKSVS